MPIVFAAISPHPPIILPDVGSEEDRKQVKKTLDALGSLAKRFEEAKPDTIIISSPHEEWGFDVPLYFLAHNFKGETQHYLMGLESPEFYFDEGKRIFKELDKNKKYALIASGDLSHCLKEDGPYGFEPDGLEFDKTLTESLKNKNLDKIFKLNEIYPKAGECGLRSFCFMLGILEAHSASSGQAWKPEILSYEGPFGVGYLAANFKFK